MVIKALRLVKKAVPNVVDLCRKTFIHQLYLSLDFRNLRLDFRNLRLDFRNLRLDFRNLRLDFRNLRLDLVNLGIDSIYTPFDLHNSYGLRGVVIV